MPQFKLGRNRPPAKRKMCLHDYRTGAPLPTPPSACTYAPGAVTALQQVYLNDELGDCVIAGMAHLIGVFVGNAGGGPAIFPTAAIIAEYTEVGGYDPDATLVDGVNQTDGGCDERTAMADWQSKGFPPAQNKIQGWVSINGANPVQVRTALWLTENLIFGVELPDAWITPFPSAPGFAWDVAGPANPNNGHCFVGVGYTAQGVIICTWGMLGVITWAAIAKYATTTGSGELYSVLTPQIIAKATAKAPNGFDFAQLTADFASF